MALDVVQHSLGDQAAAAAFGSYPVQHGDGGIRQDNVEALTHKGYFQTKSFLLSLHTFRVFVNLCTQMTSVTR
jgi:hypothetical protein